MRYQEIRDAMRRKDYTALSVMRGETETQPNLSQSVPSEGVAEVNTASNNEGYDQQGVGPAGTAPGQVEGPRAKGSVRPWTPAEIRRLAKDVEARMIAAGCDVEEAKAMGLLISQSFSLNELT